jgi:hypothetical protein
MPCKSVWGLTPLVLAVAVTSSSMTNTVDDVRHREHLGPPGGNR